MVLGLNAEVLKDGVGPEPLHVVLKTGQSKSRQSLSGNAPSPLFDHGGWDNEGHNLFSSAQFHRFHPGRITRSACSTNRLVADKEVQIFGSSLRAQVARGSGASGKKRRLVCNSRPSRSGAGVAASSAFRSDSGREDERGRIISGETWGPASAHEDLHRALHLEESHTELGEAGAAEFHEVSHYTASAGRRELTCP